jgi:phosphoribosylanthranilate isomerase
VAEVKFCGMTREADVELAVGLGARYVGVVFAESPRQLSAAQADRVLAPGRGSGVRSVGVFDYHAPDEVLSIVEQARLDAVQLHGWRDANAILALRERLAVEVWAVSRVGTALNGDIRRLFEAADGVVLDAFSPDVLGGTGRSFDWEAVAPALGEARGKARFILAGGLRPETVGRALVVLSPDVVDASSGVESSPGIKDARRMRAFMEAVQRPPTR